MKGAIMTTDDTRPWCWRADYITETANGPFDTREEALADAFDAPERKTAIIGRCEWLTLRKWTPGVEDLLEQMNERAYDNGSGPPDDPAFEIEQKHLATAQAELDAWAEKWVNVARWYNCVDETRDDEA